MKKIGLFLILLISCFFANSQFVNTQTIASPTTLYKSKGGIGGDSALLILNSYADTTSANFSASSKYDASIIRVGNKLYFRTLTPPKWNEFAVIGNTGTVTSVSQGYGIVNTPNPITTTGVIKSDTFAISTRAWRQKGVDSVQANLEIGLALKLNIVDTAAMLAGYTRVTRFLDSLSAVQTRLNTKLNISDTASMLSNYYNKTASDSRFASINRLINTQYPLTGGGDLSANRTIVADTGRSTSQLATGGALKKAIDSLASSTVSSVSSVFGRTGAVTAQTNDYSASQINKLPDSISAAVSSITLNLSGAIHNTPVNFTYTNRNWSGTATLANQSAYTVFRRGSGTGTPLFGSLDSNYFNNQWALLIRPTLSAGTGISYNATTGVITNSSPSSGGTVTSVALATGTTGTDISVSGSPITSSGTITLNIPTASATNRGALSSADWTTFNNKQNALTNPITGTGTSGQVAYFNGTTTQTGSNNLFWDNTNARLGINTNAPAYSFESYGTSSFVSTIKTGSGTNIFANPANVYVDYQHSQTSDYSAGIAAVNSVNTTANTTGTYLYGLSFVAQKTGNFNYGFVRGIVSSPYIYGSGTVKATSGITVYPVSYRDNSSAVVTNSYGVEIVTPDRPGGSGTSTNNFGIRINDMKPALATNGYGIYLDAQSGWSIYSTGGNSYHSGRFLLGSNTDDATNQLQVTGSGKFTTGLTLSNLSTAGIVTNTAAGVLGTTNGTGFIKNNGSGVITYDNSTYLTGNQTITFAPTGDVTGTTTGTTSLAPVLSIGAGKVTNAMLAGSIDLTTKVTGVLPIANGGTGSSTQNFVDLSTNQSSIGGNKTFSQTLTASLLKSPSAVIVNLDGSSIPGGGASLSLLNTAQSQGWQIQLGSSNSLSFLYNSGSGFSNLINAKSNGNLSINSSSASTSTTTGALVVTGGAGIGGALNVGSSVTVGSYIYSPGRTTSCGYRLPDWQIYNTSSNSLVLNNYTTDVLTLASTGAATFSSSVTSGTLTGGTNQLVYSNTSGTLIRPTFLTVDASNNILGVGTTSPYTGASLSLDVDGGFMVKKTGSKDAILTVINSDPAGGGNNAYVQITTGGTNTASFSTIQTYYGAGVTSGTSLRLNPSGNASVLIGTSINDGITANILQVGGAVKSTQFKLSALNTAPSSASDTGTLGEIRVDANYIYVCTSTNTWKRSALTTW